MLDDNVAVRIKLVGQADTIPGGATSFRTARNNALRNDGWAMVRVLGSSGSICDI